MEEMSCALTSHFKRHHGFSLSIESAKFCAPNFYAYTFPSSSDVYSALGNEADVSEQWPFSGVVFAVIKRDILK